MASTRKSPPSNALLERVSAVLGRHVRRGDRLVAGLSGGIDSVVMLDVLSRAAKKIGFELAALHVNHQINPAAAKWARFCRAYCRQLCVALTVVKVDVPREASVEAAARKVRYAAFAALPADFIALAHNLDDQAETLLMQLLRGAGVKGVSAMPVLRGETRGKRREEEKNLQSASRLSPAILRPLLDISRAEIEAYARRRKLTWVEDDSNADARYDRNFLRHRLLPVIAERYPGVSHDTVTREPAFRRSLGSARRTRAPRHASGLAPSHDGGLARAYGSARQKRAEVLSGYARRDDAQRIETRRMRAPSAAAARGQYRDRSGRVRVARFRRRTADRGQNGGRPCQPVFADCGRARPALRCPNLARRSS